jgi:hypothetical protein
MAIGQMFDTSSSSSSAPVIEGAKDSIGRPVPSMVKDDADLLVYRCGMPDVDDSAAYNDPRPPIVTRWIAYRRAHLKWVYIVGGGATIEDPSPYVWTAYGLINTKTNKAVLAGTLKSVLSSRPPCMLKNPVE